MDKDARRDTIRLIIVIIALVAVKVLTVLREIPAEPPKK